MAEEERGTGYLSDFTPGNYKQPNAPVTIQQGKNEQDLMQKLLDIKKQVTIPLRYTLMGWTQNIKGEWQQPEGDYQQLMNQVGINWAVQFVESYCSVEYLISNYNDEWLRYVMRSIVREIARVLCARAKDFDLNKVHIWQVGKMIEHKILSLLLGALNDGFRRWIGENRSIQEIKQVYTEGNQRSPGIISRMFNRNKGVSI